MRSLAFLLLGGVGIGSHIDMASLTSSSSSVPTTSLNTSASKDQDSNVDGSTAFDEAYWREVIAGFRPGSNPVAKADYGNAALDVTVPKLVEGRRHLSTLDGGGISTTALAIGLLHVAAGQGDPESKMALGWRYRHGEWHRVH